MAGAKPRPEKPVDRQRLRRLFGRQPAGGRTLIVDDNSADRYTLKLKLEMVLGPGVEVIATGSAGAATAYSVHDGRFDLLIVTRGAEPSVVAARSAIGSRRHRSGDGAAGDVIGLLGTLLKGPHPFTGTALLAVDTPGAELERDAIAAGFHAVVASGDLDAMTSIARVLWRLVKPDIDWSASWRGLP